MKTNLNMRRYTNKKERKNSIKNKNKLFNFTNIVLLVTMIAIILVAGTYAKYTSTVSGTDATVVANWSFEVNGENIAVTGDTKTVAFGLFDTVKDSDGQTAETDVATGLIAPGTSGSFEFTVKNTSDVTAQYAIDFNVTNANNIPIEYSADGIRWSTELADIVASDDTILAIDSGVKAITVHWRWAFSGDATADTTLGTASTTSTITVEATITATQIGKAVAQNVERAVFPYITQDFTETAISSGTAFMKQYSPFVYRNVDLFSGKTISRIGLPVKSVSSLEQNATFTIYTIKKANLAYGSSREAINTYQIEIPTSQFASTTVNKWVYIDLTDYNITVAEDETLAFYGSTDTVNISYSRTLNNPDYRFGMQALTSYSNTNNTQNIFFDIYYRDTALKEESEQTPLELALGGKNFSVLGDSISTYSGYSNNATETNSTIGSNNVYYSGSNIITNVNDTWWMQAITETGMNILVNNSYSGDTIASKGKNRAMQLHDDTGANAGTNPDIIAVYIGINDIKNGGTLANFETNYNTMISNIKTTYPDAEIFVFTLLPYRYNSASKPTITDTELETFNAVIRNVANNTAGCNIVDLYNDSGITSSNYTTYMGDEGLHPNQAGMDLITNTFINALSNKYLI